MGENNGKQVAKEIAAGIFMIPYSALISYLIYRYIPDLCVLGYEALEEAGPAIFLVYALLVGLAFLVSIPIRFFSKNIIVLNLCGLILGIPITIKFAMLFWNGLLGSFTGVMFIFMGAVFYFSMFFENKRIKNIK